MKKVDYKKDYKQLYLPKTSPEILEVPRMPFFKISGSGDPNGENFIKETEALYSLSYAVKMSYKSDDVPAGYYEYTVFPLEGVWDLLDRSKPATDKSNLKYTIMIRQPDFVTDQVFERFLEQTMRKKSNPFLEKVRFEPESDGLSCQMMHMGSFDLSRKALREWKRTALNMGLPAQAKSIGKSICPIPERLNRQD